MYYLMWLTFLPYIFRILIFIDAELILHLHIFISQVQIIVLMDRTSLESVREVDLNSRVLYIECINNSPRVLKKELFKIGTNIVKCEYILE